MSAKHLTSVWKENVLQYIIADRRHHIRAVASGIYTQRKGLIDRSVIKNGIGIACVKLDWKKKLWNLSSATVTRRAFRRPRYLRLAALHVTNAHLGCG